MIIKEITKDIFNRAEKYLEWKEINSDKDNFPFILERLKNPPTLKPREFAEELIYIVLTSGFKQTTAKRFFYKILDFLNDDENISEEEIFKNLIKIFKNKNKIKAISKIWTYRKKYCNEFYSLNSEEEKIYYLSQLPHVGQITKYHIARNLGIDCVKYDIWIQRIGVALYDDKKEALGKINNAKLNTDVKKICDRMFDILSNNLNLPRGYIDLILWKSCQQGIFKINGYSVEFTL